jgi:hypothetical protein
MVDPDTQEIATLVAPDAAEDAWPIVGPETEDLRNTPAMQRLGADAESVIAEARRVLRRCGRPYPVPSQDVGMVMGYVQSGKTFNFTTVCALARDNGYPLVIVITGISKPLLDQSNKRLQRDLRLLTRDDRKWLHVTIDTRGPSPAQRIADALEDWRDESVPEQRRQGVLITVMKNHRNLAALVQALMSVPLAGVPTLIIDDEGDQASLNYLVGRGRESTTYRQIGRLRALLPTHRFIQYTATPQAPLLINIIDALSPSFAEVLTPGSAYTGGRIFFSPAGLAQYVRTIPATEIIGPSQQLSAPPPSYRQALATFFIGVAAGELADNAVGNRSMMVHPHQTTTLHANYHIWATALKSDWQQALAASEDNESRLLVTALLRAAYDDLRTTVADLPPWDDILRTLPRAIRRTSIWEVNAAGGQTPTIPWQETYAHILVGGQAMDRGFTVEGLTVTYMPRGIGDGNADTVQQRARFFGYKQRYLGYCRVWLESIVRDSFRDYVEHEEHMRRKLIAHAESGRPLREWKRAFFLTDALRPTRQQVVDVAYRRGNHGTRWVDPTRPHDLPDVIAANNALIDSFIAGIAFEADEGDERRTPHQRHLVATVPLQQVYTQLLQELRIADPGDSLQHTALLLQIDRYLEGRPPDEPPRRNAMCTVYRMRPTVTTQRRREVDDSLGNFYQGENPSTGAARGSIYPGDRKIRDASTLTIQLHTFELTPHPDSDDNTTYPRVSIVAVHVPPEIGRSWVVQ